MSVSPASSRSGWHPSPPAGPGRSPNSQRRPANATTPVLTVTLTIPLSGDDSLSPSARRLLDVARELLERGEGDVVAVPPAPERRGEVVPAPRSAPSDAPTGHPAPVPPVRPVLHIMAASRSVLRDSEPLALTRLEFDLLLHLAAHPRRVFTRLQLLAAVWGYEHAGVRTVDVHIRRLRGKVGIEVPLVTTVYGVGYRLADEARITVDPVG